MLSRLSTRNRQRLRTVTIVLATVLIIAPAAALAGHQFNDVPNSNIFHDDIDWMKDNGVTRGCNPPDNTEYCPDENITREQMAAFMHRLETEDVFLPTDGQAADADQLDGKDSTEFAGRLFAVVAADASLARGSGAISASKVGGFAGQYEVVFDQDVTECSYNATIGKTGGGPAAEAGSITVASRSSNDGAVFVRTEALDGADEDRPFHLQVIC